MPPLPRGPQSLVRKVPAPVIKSLCFAAPKSGPSFLEPLKLFLQLPKTGAAVSVLESPVCVHWGLCSNSSSYQAVCTTVNPPARSTHRPSRDTQLQVPHDGMASTWAPDRSFGDLVKPRAHAWLYRQTSPPRLALSPPSTFGASLLLLRIARPSDSSFEHEQSHRTGASDKATP